MSVAIHSGQIKLALTVHDVDPRRKSKVSILCITVHEPSHWKYPSLGPIHWEHIN